MNVCVPNFTNNKETGPLGKAMEELGASHCWSSDHYFDSPRDNIISSLNFSSGLDLLNALCVFKNLKNLVDDISSCLQFLAPGNFSFPHLSVL